MILHLVLGYMLSLVVAVVAAGMFDVAIWASVLIFWIGGAVVTLLTAWIRVRFFNRSRRFDPRASWKSLRMSGTSPRS